MFFFYDYFSHFVKVVKCKHKLRTLLLVALWLCICSFNGIASCDVSLSFFCYLTVTVVCNKIVKLIQIKRMLLDSIHFNIVKLCLPQGNKIALTHTNSIPDPFLATIT